MKKLFQPLTLNSITLPNRIVVSPMCQYSAQDGFANNWHLVHLGQYAIGKAGAIIQEAAAVSPKGRITYSDLGIWKDEHIEKYKEITDFIKQQGSIPGIQLAHAGRKASCDKPWISRKQISPDQPSGWQTISCSPIGYHSTDHAPLQMSSSDIKQLIQDFKNAAIRAVKSGYQIIELHAAHGYLLHQFLSPLTNKREDHYGGSFENRIRLLLEIVQEVSTVLTTQSLWLRISATDWADNGWDLKQSIELCKRLEPTKVEVIDVSTGGLVDWQKIEAVKEYQVPFATQIKENTTLTVGTVGLLTEPKQIEEILQSNKADIILIGREFLRDPHFALRAAKELEVDITWPNQYERAKN
ncbi:NADH:flavin oxidoreductase/NADH oxidase [Myroides sp. LJL115]